MVIKRVQEVFAIGFAGQKLADIAVGRARCNSGLFGMAFDGEVHVRLLSWSLGVSVVGAEHRIWDAAMSG
jgi:hypothetical protein